MSGFYAGFTVDGDPEEILRFKRKMFRMYDETLEQYAGYDENLYDAIIDFTAISPELTKEREELERKFPGAYSPEYLGYEVDYSDYDDGIFWFQFTIDSDFPIDLFEAIAAEFPSLVFSGSAYEETHEFEYEGDFNGNHPWRRARLKWS